MFFDVLGRWIRAFITLALLVGSILLVKEWFDELPREIRRADLPTGIEVVRPLTTFPERVSAWKPEPDRSTGLLVGGLLLLLPAVAGRFVSPWAWKRGTDASPRLPPANKTERLQIPNGPALHLEAYGRKDAPALVLVHGLGSDRSQWREAIEDLSDHFHVIVFDLPGHGRSARMHLAEYSIESATRALDHIVRHVGADGLVIVGHSMGGMIAMQWCWQHRRTAARIAGLVVVHSTPRNPFTTMKPVMLHRALSGLYRVMLQITPPFAPLLRVMQRLEYLNGTAHWQNDFDLFAGTETREQLDRSARLYARLDPTACSRYALSMMDFWPDLSAIDVPTVVVAADQDHTTMSEASEAIARHIHGAHLETLPNSRHMGFVERRRAFAELVARFAADRRENVRRAQP